MAKQRFLTELSRYLVPLFSIVVIVQGIHVIEHIIQVVQVYRLGIPEDNALGLLGYVFQVQQTEEWLHLAFNTSYFLPLIVLAFLLRPLTKTYLPRRAFLMFVICGAVLEGWHVIEHIVIMSNVIANQGCPCPGIVDRLLGIGDTILHLFYNTITYLAILPAYLYVMQHWTRARAQRATRVATLR